MPNVYGIFGAGGNGSELLPILKNNLLNSSSENQKIFFIDDKTSKNKFYGMDVIVPKSIFLVLLTNLGPYYPLPLESPLQ